MTAIAIHLESLMQIAGRERPKVKVLMQRKQFFQSIIGIGSQYLHDSKTIANKYSSPETEKRLKDCFCGISRYFNYDLKSLALEDKVATKINEYLENLMYLYSSVCDPMKYSYKIREYVDKCSLLQTDIMQSIKQKDLLFRI